MFLKYYHYETLCRLLDEHQRHVITAQAHCRGWIQRKKYQQELQELRHAAVTMQKGVCRVHFILINIIKA